MIDRIDDIDKKRREKQNKEVIEDITNVFEGTMGNIEDYFKRKSIEQGIKRKKNSKGRFKEFLRWWGLFGLFILVINFVLGNLWVLSKLIKSLFF